MFEPTLVGAEDWMLLIRIAERHTVGAVSKPVAICRTFTRTSGQTSSNLIEMCDTAARAQANGLRLPRALEAPPEKRREIRQQLLDMLSWMLIDDCITAFSNRLYGRALKSYWTALRFTPARVAHPYTLKTIVAGTGKRDVS